MEVLNLSSKDCPEEFLKCRKLRDSCYENSLRVFCSQRLSSHHAKGFFFLTMLFFEIKSVVSKIMLIF